MLPKLLRQALLRCHLYISIVFGSVFVLLGLTGSIISWMPEFDRALNPTLLSSTYQTTTRGLAPATVQAALDTLASNKFYGRPIRLILPVDNASVIIAWYSSSLASGQLAFDQTWSRQVMLDPISLEIKGERNWGEYGVSRPLLIPTIYHLHRYFLLGEVGQVVIAVSGIMLVLMSVIGLFLWLPKPTWRALRLALTVNLSAPVAAINFRLHRMLGFFSLPVLLLMGFSGAYFNQPQWILPVIRHVLPMKPQAPMAHVDADQSAHITAAQAMQLAQDNFPKARVSRVALPTDSSRFYDIRLRQPNEMHTGDGATRVSVDAVNGRILRIVDPLNGLTGDRLLASLFPLHSGIAFDMLGRIFISCFGLVPLILMVTGLRIWRKRSV
jgi:uncharacterized iron-regulated membrane protein